MKENTAEYYFPVIKLIYILSLTVYFIIVNRSLNYNNSILEVTLLFLFVAATVFYELLERKNIFILIFSSVICIILTFIIGNIYSLLIPIVMLDLIAYFHLPLYLYLFTFIIVFEKNGNNSMYFIACVSCNIIYFQHYYIINRYKKIINSFINNEQSLKTSMENQKTRHKNDVEKFSLAFENKLLEEKSRLSQSLHDKIGHSINGSVYQLEACKLLMESNPLESRKIVQKVIDNLRKSLDEIRAILRKEKPNKGELALLQLRNLCESFNENYNINAKLTCSGERSLVPEILWEIILDNSIEAFSNALKYSGCKSIEISIVVLNKLVRCSIKDDGRGCTSIIDGMGLTGMNERTKAANGNIYITSEIGFQINMLLPIK